MNENQVPSAPVESTRTARRFPPVFRNRRFPSIATSRKNRKNVRRETCRADDVRSITAFAERFDQTFFFARSDRIRAAEVADAFAGHAPSQVARTAVTVFDFSVGGNAKTLGHAFVSLHFRHFEALSSRYKFTVGVGKRTKPPSDALTFARGKARFFADFPNGALPKAPFDFRRRVVFQRRERKKRFRFRAIRDNVILYAETRSTQGGVCASNANFPEKLPFPTFFPFMPTLYRPVKGEKVQNTPGQNEKMPNRMRPTHPFHHEEAATDGVRDPAPEE